MFTARISIGRLRRWQFSICSLLLLTIVCALVCWYATHIQQRKLREEREWQKMDHARASFLDALRQTERAYGTRGELKAAATKAMLTASQKVKEQWSELESFYGNANEQLHKAHVARVKLHPELYLLSLRSEFPCPTFRTRRHTRSLALENSEK